MRFICRIIFLSGFCLAAASQAHQVPNMTIEAVFDAAGTYEMKVNVDPRVFLSTQPTSLAPVVASWYLDQTPEQVQATLESARGYLEKNLKLTFGATTVPLPECAWQAMDGATNLPVQPETTEVHLLATLKGTVPPESGPFVLHFGAEAKVSLILLLSKSGQPEPKVQVIFPGETSRAYEVPQTQRRETDWMAWLSAHVVALAEALAVLGVAAWALWRFFKVMPKRPGQRM